MKFITCILCLVVHLLNGEELKVIGLTDTYFSYSSEDLKKIEPDSKQMPPLTLQIFEQWDPTLYQLTYNDTREADEKTRFMAYLYVAQRDFALLAYQLNHQWVGQPDLLIAKIIHLFYPHFEIPPSSSQQTASQAIGDLVFDKILKRYQYELSHLREYPPSGTPHEWHEKPPFIGQKVGSCLPWLIGSVNDYLAPKPPPYDSIIWRYSLDQIEDAQAHLTPAQRKLIFYWGNQLGPKKGNWFAIVNQDLSKKQLNLPDFLYLRAALAMGYIDAAIAVYNAKYTYWVIRPHMRDSAIQQIIPVPKHPSYPAGHSTVSAFVATLLSHYYPSERIKWQNLAIQCGNTRIWGGLHYTYDHVEGMLLGEKVGNGAIKRLVKLNLDKGANRTP